MSITTYIQQAISNIKTHLLQSFLTLLGVLIGTASVVALLTGSELAAESALSQFKKLGTDLLALNLAENNRPQDSTSVCPERLTKIVAPSVLVSAPYTNQFSSVIFGNDKMDLNIIGATEEFQTIMKLDIEAGRFVSNLDKSASYCVLGNSIAYSLNEEEAALIGKQIRINNIYFTIVGVLKPADKNLFLFADSNQSIFIPVKTSLMLSNNLTVKNYIFKIDSMKKPVELEKEISKQLHFTFPTLQFHFSSPETIIKNMENQNQIFKLLLGFIGCVALVVGGIGVMNIMLVSVSERKREIGIRMAVGAGKKDILYLFLAEATVLTLTGGLLGIIFGEMLALITAILSHWEYHFLITPIITGFLVSVAVGLFFGYYPAYKASQLDPIEILRSA